MSSNSDDRIVEGVLIKANAVRKDGLVFPAHVLEYMVNSDKTGRLRWDNEQQAVIWRGPLSETPGAVEMDRMLAYDSTQEIYAHQSRVDDLLSEVMDRLSHRGFCHDNSKLDVPEKPLFDAHTQALKGLAYGSAEYAAQLALLKPALDHHYAENAHHPEHWPHGVEDMSLLDLLEMLADWKAAGERHQRADCNLLNSLRKNKERFKIPDVIYTQLLATAVELGWINIDDFTSLERGWVEHSGRRSK